MNIFRQFIIPGGIAKKFAGFTAVELLIAVLLAAIITSAAMVLYITQQKQLLVQDDVSDIQAGLRAAAAELTSKIRMAGYELPDGFTCLIAHDTNPDTIEVVANALDLGNIQIEHAMPTPSSELRCDGHDISGLHQGDTLYIYDSTNNTGEYFVATEIELATSTILHNATPLSRCYPQGSKILKLEDSKYYIDNSDANHPNLMIVQNGGMPQIYAENITDLDFQYLLSSGQIVNVPPSNNMIREVLITLSGRTDKADNEFFTPYRNRTLVTRAKIRNLGIGG